MSQIPPGDVPGRIDVVLSTCPNEDSASELAGGLIEARLAACVNILPQVRSVFRWRGEVQVEAEVLMVIKTTANRTAELEAWLLEHHPYDVPEVLVLPVEGGSRAYLDWLTEETQK